MTKRSSIPTRESRPLVSVAVISPDAPHVPPPSDSAIRLAGFPSEAVVVDGENGVNCSPAVVESRQSLSDGQ